MTPVTDHRPAATTASARPGTRRPGRRLLARLRANASINAGLLVGLAAFFGLIGAVPVYVHLASSAVFAEIEREAVEADRAPFSYFFDVDADGPLRWADYEATTEVLLGDLDLGVDVADRDVRLSSRRFDLVADGGSPSDGSDATAATSLALSSSRRFAELVDLIAGDPLPTSATAPGRPIPVLVSARLVDELGLVVGQRRTLVDTAVAADAAIRRTPIEVVGVWEANDEFDPRWIVRPQFFADDLIVGEADLLALTEGDRPPAIDQIQWYLLASTAGVGPDRIADIVDRQGEIAELAAELGPGVGLRRGPDLVLDEFLRRADALQSTLTSYAAPATVVVALFVLMVVARNAETRRGELAVLRSRGVPLRRTFAGLTIETAAVIAVALALAPAVAFAVASLMIRTRAFLDIDPGRPTPGFWQFGALPLVVLGLAAIAVLVAHLLALVGPARTTIVDRRSAAGRGRLTAVTTGLRSRVDLFVIVAVVVAVWRRDRPRPLTATGVIDDPGIVVVPAALGLVAGLTLHRILPVLMRLVAGLL
ncbi:MAG: FtsX-like permease family protein, partial [Actinomycetota bacterium]